MGYCSSSDISALTPHLVSGASDFTTSTSPTLAQVTAWISSGCSVVNAKLAVHGYGAISTTSIAYEFARQANALYGAWMAERSRISARVTNDPNTRDRQFKRDFTDMIDMLVELDLTRMGVSRTNRQPDNWAGGVDVQDKDDNSSDTSIVQPRFARGQFDNIESQKPRISGS